MKEKESKPISRAKSPNTIKDFQLSEHFSFYELTRTSYDEYQRENRTLTKEQIKKLEKLCKEILEPIRVNFRLPVQISSGYRSKGLNKKIGGALQSQHALCEAADFSINGLDDLEGSLHIWEWIYMESDIKFGQLIHEYVRTGIQSGVREKIWIHISLGEPFRKRAKSRQVYKYKKLGRANGLYLPVPNPRQLAK